MLPLHKNVARNTARFVARPMAAHPKCDRPLLDIPSSNVGFYCTCHLFAPRAADERRIFPVRIMLFAPCTETQPTDRLRSSANAVPRDLNIPLQMRFNELKVGGRDLGRVLVLRHAPAAPRSLVASY